MWKDHNMDGTNHFQVGEKVRVLVGGWVGTVDSIDPLQKPYDGICLTVVDEAGNCMCCEPEAIEPYCPEPTEAQWSSYQHAYCWFNEQLFNNELEPCILTFSKKA